jgi:hypothetical protein
MRHRGFQTLGFLLLLVFALFSLSQGSTLISKNEKTLSIENQSQDTFGLAKNDLEHYQKFSRLTSSYFVYEDDSVGEKMTTDVYGFKGKSVKRAFLYSLIVPGTGEFYAGSKIKAFLFFGLDVALWSLYFNYHGKGSDKEDEYQTFADQHWIEDDYRNWLHDTLGIEPDANGEISDTSTYWDSDKDEWTYLSHHLPDRKTGQYYEMVGKYDQFKFGWDDFPEEDLNQIHRNIYLDIRRESNDWLNKAKYSAMFSLANHILSAFDAAIAVKRYNKKGERFSQLEFKMRLTERNDEIVPKLFMSMKF